MLEEKKQLNGFECLKNCSICDSEIEEDNGDIVGNFGISPVAFCVWCLSSITDMVYKINGIEQNE